MFWYALGVGGTAVVLLHVVPLGGERCSGAKDVGADVRELLWGSTSMQTVFNCPSEASRYVLAELRKALESLKLAYNYRAHKGVD